ncbi:hypothetical protein EYV94_10640 [Puteibacter caeruleilacunae]|nr:hypothetical protein EYV94_10640 [Puteibacter caeruleilacunae]
MDDIIGFSALALALFALSQKNIAALRCWHLMSSILYVVYGYIITSYPVMLGAAMFSIIHIWHIKKNFQTQ